ncbi:MAG: low specificity L-threonine aldolase [Bacteroidales bacterium]|jgi:threonine aldolase|nr:low specificity L-threonine aldolase [Bacteroidales bacterium]
MIHSIQFKGFASDNNAAVHPRIMKAMEEANYGHCLSYGDDPYTEQAVRVFKEQFGQRCQVFFVFNGTGANVLSLQTMTQPYHAVICADSAHIHLDECGAPVRFTGCTLLFQSTRDGKLTIPDIARHIKGIGEEHHAQPHVVSITQSTELGTVYTVEEIKAIAEFTHSHRMFLHMDGARAVNAAAFLNVSLREMVADTGVDALSFGGSKNGMMFGEAIVILNPALAENFRYIRKQGMQLFSKMRYIAVQFIESFKDDLWLQNAQNANCMAQLLSRKAQDCGVKVTQPTQANTVFAVLPPEVIGDLQKQSYFFIWDEACNEVRWVCSWDTTENDIDCFVELLKQSMIKHGKKP